MLPILNLSVDNQIPNLPVVFHMIVHRSNSMQSLLLNIVSSLLTISFSRTVVNLLVEFLGPGHDSIDRAKFTWRQHISLIKLTI
jgi:hypothetical protein